MKRPTIPDLAEAAGVSVSTVNRILSGSNSVRPATMQRVQHAAETIGYHGMGAISDRVNKVKPRYRLAFLLQQSHRELYQLIARKISLACRARRDDIVEPLIEFVDILTPENISARLMALGKECDAVGVIAADHPLIGHTIRDLSVLRKPVISYITDQSAPERAAYVGTDNWKLGRTAAFLISRMTPADARIAVFIGNHRFMCQDVADASFRSYMREHAPGVFVEDSRPTHENPDEAYNMVSDLLAERTDLAGIFIVGGGISGVLKALRETSEDRRNGIRLICRDIGPETRKGLTEGLITAALCHPLETISDTLVDTMIEAIINEGRLSAVQRTVPLEIVTPENC